MRPHKPEDYSCISKRSGKTKSSQKTFHAMTHDVVKHLKM